MEGTESSFSVKEYLMRLNTVCTLLLASFFVACGIHDVQRDNILPETLRQSTRKDIQDLKNQSPFLKAHMKNGNLYLFDLWDMDNAHATISGHASLYGAMRELIRKDDCTLGLDSIALLETNVIRNSGSSTALTVFTGITTAITAFCITNPKACFGSCPTFYVSDGDSLRLQTEGFSSSISPSLEATDVDALYHAHPSHGELLVEMRNEALETHVVRSVDVLVVPSHDRGRVFATQDHQFWRASDLIPPVSATAGEGDCLPALLQADGRERYSLADDTDLGTKEEINLEFDVQPGQSYGLVVGSRQTLLPTYLLYQALAYMGNDAGYWLAQVERKKLSEHDGAIERMIGGIELLLASPGKEWEVAGVINEHGPLASDIHLIPIRGSLSRESRLKLRMTRGAWRLDYVALARLAEPVTPVRLHPYSVLCAGQEDSTARASLLDSARVLVTLPGDRYTMKYKLPEGYADFDYFLESRGYYLEWIRKEWVEEENPAYLAEMFLSPARSLRRLAPEFKRVEAQMEDCFWRSRYAKP